MLGFAPAVSDPRLRASRDGFELVRRFETLKNTSAQHTDIAADLRARIPNLRLVAATIGDHDPAEPPSVVEAMRWAIGRAPDVLYIPDDVMSSDGWSSDETVDQLASAWERGCLPFTIVRDDTGPPPSGVLVVALFDVSPTVSGKAWEAQSYDIGWRVLDRRGKEDSAAVAASVAEYLTSLPATHGALAHLERVSLLGIPYPPQMPAEEPARLLVESNEKGEIQTSLVGRDGQTRTVSSPSVSCHSDNRVFVLDQWIPCDVRATDAKIYFDRTASRQAVDEVDRRLIVRAAEQARLLDVLAAGHLARLEPIFHVAGVTTFRTATEPIGRRSEIAERLLRVHVGTGPEALLVTIASDAHLQKIR